jgi:integrase
LKRGRVYNKFYTPELWEQVNEDNKEILDDFIAECKQQKKSDGTIYGYYQDLRIVLIYILKKLRNKYILDLNRKHFRGLSLYLSEECGMSNNRVNRIKSACNSMLTFCEEDDDYDYDVNYSKKVKGLPKESVKDNEDDFFFTFDEFIKVRDILVKRGKLQLAVMWSLAFDSGARRNEVFQVKKQGLLDGNYTNEVVGKRKKKFKLPYLNDTKELIRQYLEQRGEDDIESLWYKEINGIKSEISSDTLYDRILMINKILSEVRGEECNIFFHTIRHSRIECLVKGQDNRMKDENGNNIKYPLEKVMVLAHHSSSDTTRAYCKNNDEETISNMFGF